QPAPLGFPLPGRDIGPRAGQRVLVVAHVVGERAAALLVLYSHDLDTMAGEQVDGGLIDPRRQHLLRTSLQQRDPSAPLALRGYHTARGRSRWRQAPRRQRQHRLDSTEESWIDRTRWRRRQQ